MSVDYIVYRQNQIIILPDTARCCSSGDTYIGCFWPKNKLKRNQWINFEKLKGHLKVFERLKIKQFLMLHFSGYYRVTNLRFVFGINKFRGLAINFIHLLEVGTVTANPILHSSWTKTKQIYSKKLTHFFIPHSYNNSLDIYCYWGRNLVPKKECCKHVTICMQEIVRPKSISVWRGWNDVANEYFVRVLSA